VALICRELLRVATRGGDGIHIVNSMVDLHFLLLGAALFAGFSSVRQDQASREA
jgi:hypothetical protein